MRLSNTPETKKSSSDTFLKTTTWGALIAFTLVASMAGYYGYGHRGTTGSLEPGLESATAQTSDSPVQAPTERDAARTSQNAVFTQVLNATTARGARRLN